jgi:hypothetical protein
VQVPLMDPSDLPPVRTGAAGAPAFSSLVGEVVGRSAAASPPSSFEEAVAADSLGLHIAEPESLSERVLSATIQQLLTAAHDTLGEARASTAEVVLGRAECEAARAAVFLEELQVRGGLERGLPFFWDMVYGRLSRLAVGTHGFLHDNYRASSR